VEGSGHGLTWDCILAFAWKHEKTPKILRIVDVQTDVWTNYLLDMSQKCLVLDSTFSVIDPYKQKQSIRNQAYRKVGIKNLVTEIEEKLLHFCNVRGI
jgi:hypothetical protein